MYVIVSSENGGKADGMVVVRDSNIQVQENGRLSRLDFSPRAAIVR